MNHISGMKAGALLILLAIVLLSAGCTQPSGVTTLPSSPTTIPAPTQAAPPVNLTQKTELAGLAASFAREFDERTFTAAIKEGPNSTEFSTVIGQLKAFQATDSRIAYVYTLAQQNGTVRFIIVSDYGSPNSAKFMMVYPDAPDELKIPVAAPMGVGPYTDPWGTFISGYAPLNMSTNETTYLMAVDMRV
jgi:hypothetical protein